MSAGLETKEALDQWRVELCTKAIELQKLYITKHEEQNRRLAYKKRGWVSFRVRQREAKTGMSISIEWYKLIYMNSKPYSCAIKKGVRGGALLRNLKKGTQSWEYDLAVEIIEELRPIEEALYDVSSMLRIYHHAVKSLNEISYSCLDDLVENSYVVDNEIDWLNDSIPDWYQGN